MMKWRWDGEVRMMDTAEGGGDEMVLRWNGGKSFCRIIMADWTRTEFRKNRLEKKILMP